MQRFELSSEDVINVVFSEWAGGGLVEDGGVQWYVSENDGGKHIKVRVEREHDLVIVADAFLIH